MSVQGPHQTVTRVLDEVVSPTKAYYSFIFKFNNEEFTLYHGILIQDSTNFSPPKPGIFCAAPAYDSTVYPNSLNNAGKKQWLIDTYSKENIDFDTTSKYLRGVKP